jgi:hypothetical protein
MPATLMVQTFLLKNGKFLLPEENKLRIYIYRHVNQLIRDCKF